MRARPPSLLLCSPVEGQEWEAAPCTQNRSDRSGLARQAGDVACLFLCRQPSVLRNAKGGGPRAEPTPPLPPRRPTGRELPGSPRLCCVLRIAIVRREATYTAFVNAPGHSAAGLNFLPCRAERGWKRRGRVGIKEPPSEAPGPARCSRNTVVQAEPKQPLASVSLVLCGRVLAPGPAQGRQLPRPGP